MRADGIREGSPLLSRAMNSPVNPRKPTTGTSNISRRRQSQAPRSLSASSVEFTSTPYRVPSGVKSPGFEAVERARQVPPFEGHQENERGDYADRHRVRGDDEDGVRSQIHVRLGPQPAAS